MLPEYKECRNAYFVKSGATLRLQSNGYPNGYEFYSFCTYLLESSANTKINLKFYDFNLEDTYDYMEIGNGNNPGDRDSVIARYDGTMMPPSISAESNTMWIFFYADYSISGKGFSVGATASDPGEMGNIFSFYYICFIFRVNIEYGT